MAVLSYGASRMMAKAKQSILGMRTELRFRKTFRKYREFTMIPEATYIANLWLAAKVDKIPGEVVECGTWRGGMIAGVADVLGSDRNYRLFDSFEGLPPAKEIDGAGALAWQQNTSGPFYRNNCRAEESEARQAMAMSAGRRHTITKGWFNETLPKAQVGPIALLLLDADWYDSTKQILDNLGCRMVPGGLIVVDDYYVWSGCTRAVNEHAASKNWMIRQFGVGGGCYIVI
jgi:O-methyltransferase